MTNSEIDKKIFEIIKYLSIHKYINGLKLDPEIRVECKDNEKEYTDYISFIIYDNTYNLYKMLDNKGNKIPFSFLKNPIVVLNYLLKYIKL